MIAASTAIHIFTVNIKRKTQDYSLLSKNRLRYIEWFLKRIIEFEDWYFSYEYQIPFTFSMFSLIFILSNAMPLIMVFGCLFFFIKLYLEFNDRIIYQNTNLQVESKCLNL